MHHLVNGLERLETFRSTGLSDYNAENTGLSDYNAEDSVKPCHKHA